jgi:hypothetical protein
MLALARPLPGILRKIDDDRLGSAPDHDPAERELLRPVDFPAHQPSRHVKKICRVVS